MRFSAWHCCCLLALLAWAPLVHAQTAVYRCLGAQGEPVFSGEPCGTPAPPAGTRAGAASPSAPFKGVCAGSPTALKDAIAGAFARHDVNHLAGLILWRGMGTGSAHATLGSLAAWLQQPLAGITLAYAGGPLPAQPDQTPGAATPSRSTATAARGRLVGVSIATAGNDASTRDFGVMEMGGCWWLTF
ncbi:MAG: DUF4124 domain-containing protein [Rhodanobacteraceae bacterium]|nr:MAG: DUF4124 domain-containing protein [Rhodanobacteraceae bacterium]